MVVEVVLSVAALFSLGISKCCGYLAVDAAFWWLVSRHIPLTFVNKMLQEFGCDVPFISEELCTKQCFTEGVN
jgi:hypothetical protein